MNVYVGTNTMKNAYIGDYGWKPGANTLFYYPLTANANDTSGNGRNGTTVNTTFSSSNGAYFRGGYSAGSNGTLTTATFTMGTTYTINTWIKSRQALSGNHEIDIHHRWTGSARYVLFYVNASGFGCLLGNGSTSQGSQISASFTMGTDWHNICFTRSGSNIAIYADGQQITSGNGGYATDPGYYYVGNNPSNPSDYSCSSYFKDYIMENKVRTAQEIQDYYDLTKSKYGL